MTDIHQQINQILKDAGMTLSEYLEVYGSKSTEIFKLSPEAQCQYDQYYDKLDRADYSGTSKGKLLEDLSSVLFNEKIFRILRNRRTSTNEIDLLLDWSEHSRAIHLNTSYPCFGDTLLCECKNYQGAVSVTYIGKFASLLISSHADIGIMIAWEGVTGSGWSNGAGLIKKLALGRNCRIIVLDKNDLKRIRKGEDNVFNIVHTKDIALKMDIDYEKYLEKHEAESALCCS